MCFVCHIRVVAAAVWRVLRDDGTFWLNLGDTYSTHPSGLTGAKRWKASTLSNRDSSGAEQAGAFDKRVPGLKEKDLAGIPWRVALALQADGWYLRSDVVWAKKCPMPESIRDRPTRAHEYVFVLTKKPSYFYDQDGFREPATASEWPGIGPQHAEVRNRGESSEPMTAHSQRNLRSVWDIPTRPYPEAHFAVFPEDIPERIIKIGTSEKGCCADCGAQYERVIERKVKDPKPTQASPEYASANGGHSRSRDPSDFLDQALSTSRRTVGWKRTCDCATEKVLPCVVLDIFSGSGTTCAVARKNYRRAIGFEINPVYAELARKRCAEASAVAYPKQVSQSSLGQFEDPPVSQEIENGSETP